MNEKEISEVLLKEEEFILQELRSIHDRKILIFKTVGIYIVGLVSYLFAGIVFYVKSQGVPVKPIPLSVAYCYSTIGIFLALCLYFLVHNIYYHIGPSKKHTVRYWKAIHSIRTGLKELSGVLDKYLILPNCADHPLRPRLSNRWDLGIFIYPLYHLLFYGIFVMLFLPCFIDTQVEESFVLPCKNIMPMVDSAMFLLPVLIFKLAIGCRAMRKYWENIQLSRLMSCNNIFPKEKHYYQSALNKVDPLPDETYLGRSDEPNIWRKVFWWSHFGLVLSSIIISILYFTDKNLFNGSTIIAVLIITLMTITTIMIDIFYLKSYHINFKIVFSSNGIAIQFGNPDNKILRQTKRSS